MTLRTDRHDVSEKAAVRCLTSRIPAMIGFTLFRGRWSCSRRSEESSCSGGSAVDPMALRTAASLNLLIAFAGSIII
jgi:hypothetical protein